MLEATSWLTLRYHENYTLLGYYTASSGDFLLTFWDNLIVPSSGANNPKSKPVTLARGLYMEECGRQEVLSGVVPSNRVDASWWEGQGKCSHQCYFPLPPSTWINPIGWHHITENLLLATPIHV